MKKNKGNIIKFSLITGLTALSMFSINTFKMNTKDFSLNSDLLVKADDNSIELNGDSVINSEANRKQYFNIQSESNPDYDGRNNWNLYNLTLPYQKSATGILSYKNRIKTTDSFDIKGRINVGAHPSSGGGDGLAMFFHDDDPDKSKSDLQNSGGGLGALGYKDVYGFKVDTYYNSNYDTKVGTPYASIFKGSDDNTSIQDVNNETAQPTKVSLTNGSNNTGELKDFELNYDGNTKTLTVNYNGKTWKVVKPLTITERPGKL